MAPVALSSSLYVAGWHPVENAPKGMEMFNWFNAVPIPALYTQITYFIPIGIVCGISIAKYTVV